MRLLTLTIILMLSIRSKIRTGLLNNCFLSAFDWSLDRSGTNTQRARYGNYIARTIDPKYGTWEAPHPMLLSSKSNSADNPKWFEAINGPFREQFAEAVREAIKTLTKINAWNKVKRENWMNVLKSTWAFKIKRYLNGSIRKFKGRFCVRGDAQIEGVDFEEACAPVGNWIIVRVLLVLSQLYP